MDKEKLMREALGKALRGFRSNRKMTLSAVADPVGYDAGNLSRVERGTQGIASDVLVGIADALDVSLARIYEAAELIYKGETVDFSVTRTSHYTAGGYQQESSVEESKSDYSGEVLKVPMMNAEFSMGSGIYQPERDAIVDFMHLSLPWIRSRLVISRPDALRVVIGLGDSMYPTFSSGDPLLVDTGITELKIDAVYCLAREDELLIKRIQRQIDGGFAIISDNPSYQPQYIASPEAANLRVLGRVVWAWNGRSL
ncbi:hypothetical protein CAI21_21610 [Alkalilimnicola ehrlichii]|uniref:HTH cro/C1-type domain-containing protein n=1 Tax=Alkalilimnicola ehrlichii TaxID=351052 RepID=A0A3E0WQD8_9GAMM|nr:XRE family transcriptional regulator [Alkalilimnicola ehrlichii]RFA24423.1 hypothetical protein CAI21_21610 [Alkalilimnicola ehrlichii]RFA35164.1 hypothetical protein CAL65_13755 [Alkalilimnicola ehrlichii]